MEATQLSLAKSLLDSVLSVAKSLLADELVLQMGVTHDLSFIRDEFATIQAALKATDERQSRRPLDLAWVAQVKDLAYDAEDSLQGFSVELASKPSSCYSVSIRRPVGTMLKNLRARVEEVSQRRCRYLLGNEDVGFTLDETGSMAAASGGRDEHEANRPKAVDLVKLLEDNEKKQVARLNIISLCSAGNDGARAAILRAAYAHPRVSKAFSCRAWVTLPRPPDRPTDFPRSALRQFYANALEDEARRKREESESAQDIKLEEVVPHEAELQIEILDQNVEIEDGTSQTDRINGLGIAKRMAGMSDCQVYEEFARHIRESRYNLSGTSQTAILLMPATYYFAQFGPAC